jgi:hypothetical protein
LSLLPDCLTHTPLLPRERGVAFGCAAASRRAWRLCPSFLSISRLPRLQLQADARGLSEDGVGGHRWGGAFSKAREGLSILCKHTLKKKPISVSVSVKDSPDEDVYDQLPDDTAALQLKELNCQKRGFRVGEFRLITVQGAKNLKDEEVLAADELFLRLKMILNVIGGCSA